ncbi:hypothetical protein T05_11234 [Trichinella murrelli]|uniref:Uncharacterized protein n=1 Tax=Trichinella murrelli TaxID=144512 RepID=A0A0V0UI53_9BILA|nr:hypothetical protein T05_11234 [Trichinella murrelli]
MTPCQVLCTDLLLIEQQVFLQNRFYLTAATLWCITVKIIAKNGWTIPCIFFKKYCAYKNSSRIA